MRPALLTMTLLCLCPCGDVRAERPRNALNVLLISIDSLRPDHLGCYGYARPTSSHLDAFRGEAALFRRAYSTSNCTIPAHGSLMTGRLPREHGAVENYMTISPDAPTLAERLRETGYATRAVVSSAILGKWCGLGRGFDLYDDYSVLFMAEQAAPSRSGEFDELLAVPGSFTTAQATRALRALAADARPFFLFVHYYDPHYVYVPSPPYRKRFVRPYHGMLDPKKIAMHSQDAGSLGQGDLRHLTDLYDAEIANVDACVGDLLTEVKRLRLTESTIIWIISDHGQEFGEHGGLLHGRTLFEEIIRVAMLVRLPGGGGEGRRVDHLASLTDVAPTILDLLGRPTDRMPDARSLRECLQGDGGPAPRSHVVAEARRQIAVVGRRYKLLTVEGMADRSFDLTVDPSESKPLRDMPGPLMGTFTGIARARKAMRPPGGASSGPARAIPDDLAKRLRALGYAVP